MAGAPVLLVASGGGNLPTLAIDPWVGLGLALLLVALNGFFVAAEFALAKVRPTQIEPHAARGERRGKVAANMITHLDAYLSATQLGITLASIALGWVGEPAFAWIVEPLVSTIPGAGAGAGPLGGAHRRVRHGHRSCTSCFGELVPKSIAIRGARRHDALDGAAALPLLLDRLPGDLAAQPHRQRHPAPGRHPPRLRARDRPQRGGAPAAARLAPGRAPLRRQARPARQRLRALRPRRPPGDGAARRRRLPLDRAPARREPRARAPHRPHPLPALRRRPRPDRRPDPHQGPLPRRGGSPSTCAGWRGRSRSCPRRPTLDRLLARMRARAAPPRGGARRVRRGVGAS